MRERGRVSVRDTKGGDYAERLYGKEFARWKQIFDVQAPYRWNIKRHHLGRTLDIGCGIGRNLKSLPEGSVGVDHNESSVSLARQRGLKALTTEEWSSSTLRRVNGYDSLLVAHVIEHMSWDEAVEVMGGYLPYLKPGGRVLFICPQERGYASDSTHVRWTSGQDLMTLAKQLGLEARTWSSFPFPRVAGRFFTYNEFNVVAYKPG